MLAAKVDFMLQIYLLGVNVVSTCWIHSSFTSRALRPILNILFEQKGIRRMPTFFVACSDILMLQRVG